MSESISLDALQQDLGNVDLTPTVPKNGSIVRMRVTKAQQETSKNTGAQMLVFYLSLAEPVQAHGKDVTVQPGQFTKQYNIVLTAKSKDGLDRRPMILRDMAAFRQSTTGSKSGAFFPLEQYVGCEVTVKLKTTEDDTYGLTTEIARFLEPAKQAAVAELPE